MRSSTLIAGLFIGAAAGLVGGILFAPDKGTATRKKIAEKAGDIADALKKVFNDLVNGTPAALAKNGQKGSMLGSEMDTFWSV